LDDGGLTATDITAWVAAEMLIGTPLLSSVRLLSVALTKRWTVPGALPAVKEMKAPEVELSVPMDWSLRVQAYAAPDGQVQEQLTEAAKSSEPPGARAAEEGRMDTEVRTGVDDIVMVAPLLCWVTPPRVPLAKSVTDPALLPALNVTELPAVELSVPIEGLLRDHV
jgi:hypothetical protein